MSLFSESPSLGRIVHYVMQDADYLKEGAYAGGGAPPVQGATPPNMPRRRPAMIVETWGNEKQSDPAKQTVNLVVFADGMNDGYPANSFWRTSVRHSEDPKEPGTWHWPERA